MSPRLTPRPHVPPTPADCGYAVVCVVLALERLGPAPRARVSPIPDHVHPAARRPPSARPATTYWSPF